MIHPSKESEVTPRGGATTAMVDGSERDANEVLGIVEACQNPAFLRQQSSLHREYSSTGFDLDGVDEDDVELGLGHEGKEGQVEEPAVSVVNPEAAPKSPTGPRLVFMRPLKQQRPNTASSTGTPGAHSVSGMLSNPNSEIDLDTLASNEDVQMHLVEAELVAVEVEDDQCIENAGRKEDPGQDQPDILHAVPVPEAKFVRHFKCCGRDFAVNLLVMAIFLVMLLVLIAALSMEFAHPSRSNVSTPVPTMPTNEESQNVTRFDSLRSFLTGRVTANGTHFDDRETPQYKALDWLANEDLAEVSVVKQGDDRVIQRYVLAVLYFSTGGPDWYYSMNFLTPDHECDWKDTDEMGNVKGVLECKGNWGAGVSDLRLYWNNLRGTIPDEIGSLASVHTLALNINHLHGSIPAKFPKDLNQLFLSDNNFTGTVPMEVGSLTNLDTLSIYDNPGLTGNFDLLCQEGELLFFPADCGGMSPTVECNCCTHCCDQEATECCEVGAEENSTDACWDPTPEKKPSF